MDTLRPEGQQSEILENLKPKLNPLLSGYFEGRLDQKTRESAKEAFLSAFYSLSNEEKRAYRDYVYQIIKNEIPNDDQRLDAIVDLLNNMDKLEVYAGICNACKLTFFASDIKDLGERNIVTSGEIYQEPTFSVQQAKATKNGKTIDYGNLSTEYMGNGQYKLSLDDLGLPNKEFYMIGSKSHGGVIVYDTAGYKVFETQKFKKEVAFKDTRLGVQVKLSLKIWK